MEKVMKNLKSDLCSREYLDLEIQRIVNRKLYEYNFKRYIFKGRERYFKGHIKRKSKI